MNTSDNPNLDFLRATAVIFVFIGHLTFFRGITYLGPLKIYPMGYWGVFIFFVHTSLVLMLSLERQWSMGVQNNLFRSFMIRRCFRIFPLSVFVVSFIALFHIPQQSIEHGYFVGASQTKWETLSNLLLIQNLTKSGSVLGPLWSLPYEMQMYLFLPLLFVLLRLSKNLWRFILFEILSVAVAIFSFSHSWIPDFVLYVPCFLPGVLAYLLMRRGRAKLPSFLWPVTIFALTILFFLRTLGPFPGSHA